MIAIKAGADRRPPHERGGYGHDLLSTAPITGAVGAN
jgi:hypothetical protein